MNKTTYIAFVDDHVLLRNALAMLVDSFEGYKVLFEADNGKDFIRQLKLQFPPDIVLLDISMPVMNGYETAKWIGTNLSETKIVILSMMENDAAIISMLKLGAKGYILKDSKPAVFKEALNRVRDHGFYINEIVTNKMLFQSNATDGIAANVINNLTEREVHFLKLSCTEKTYKAIADEMNVSPRTVDSYRDQLFEKLGVSSRVGLVMYAIKNGIVDI